MFIIEIPFCDLDLLYKSKQAFRWIKVNEGKYIIPYKDKITLAQQRKDKKAILCSEDDFYDYWYNYFDINYDYLESSRDIVNFIKLYCNKSIYTKLVIERNINLRIVRNDIIESIIYFAFSSDNKEKFETLLRLIGVKKHNSLNGMQINWYQLPPLNTLNIIPTRFTRIPLDEFELISNINNRLKSNDSILRILEASDDYEEVYKTLEMLYNNPIWIKNIMFYSLGFKEAFPITEKDKNKLELLKLKPSYFKEYNNIKGLLLEYTKLIKRKV